jgi:hypothetical protein
MLKTKKEDLDEMIKLMQEAMLMGVKACQKENKQMDFAVGFAHGVQAGTLAVLTQCINTLTKDDTSSGEIIVKMILTLKAVHEAGHAIEPSDIIECEGVHEIMTILWSHVAKSMVDNLINELFNRKKEGEK